MFAVFSMLSFFYEGRYAGGQAVGRIWRISSSREGIRTGEGRLEGPQEACFEGDGAKHGIKESLWDF